MNIYSGMKSIPQSLFTPIHLCASSFNHKHGKVRVFAVSFNIQTSVITHFHANLHGFLQRGGQGFFPLLQGSNLPFQAPTLLAQLGQGALVDLQIVIQAVEFVRLILEGTLQPCNFFILAGQLTLKVLLLCLGFLCLKW